MISSTEQEPVRWIGKHLPCPKCGSKDNASYNEYGIWHCFGCLADWYDERYDTRKQGECVGMLVEEKREQFEQEVATIETIATILPEGVFTAIKDRGISEDTCRKYDVTCDLDFDGRVVTHHYPYCDSNGVKVAVKTRTVEGKRFSWSGATKQVKSFFGQHIFQPKSTGNNFLFITEGCSDCMAIYQMTGYPAVSVPNGATSLAKTIKDNYDYVNSFDKIYICMDNDKVGRESLEVASALFPPRKTYISFADKSKGCKDANDYLMKGLELDFKKDMWWNAKQFIPDGIYDDLDTIWKEVQGERNKGGGHPYPWVGLNKLLYGMSAGELVTVIAGTGSGKSTVLRELQYHLLKTTDERMGLLMLEETIGRTALGVMSLEANIPLHKPDAFVSEQDLKSYYDRTIGLGKISFYGGFKCFDIDTIKARIEYMIRGCDCKYIFLDHISILVSNQEVSDERKTLDAVAHCLAEIAVSYNVCIIMVSHLRRTGAKPHEEGGQTSLQDIRGSQGIGQLSFTVLGLERNQQAKDPKDRNTILIRVLKNRKFGETGPACKLVFDSDTGRLKEVPLDGEDYLEGYSDNEVEGEGEGSVLETLDSQVAFVDKQT